MRLAVLNPHMNTNYSGPTVFMNRLFGEIASRPEYKVIAVGPKLPDVRSEHITYRRLHVPDLRHVGGQIAWICSSVFWLWRYRRLYDCVHFHGTYTFNLICALAPLLLRKPYVLLPLGAGGDLNERAKSNRLLPLRIMKKLLLRKSQVAFALSDENATELRVWQVPADRIVRINNPASEDFFRSPNLKHNYSHDLVFVGKLGQGKRPNEVVNALHHLRKSAWADAKLTLVGPFETSVAEEEAYELVERLGVTDAVRITGYVSNPAEVLRQIPHGVFVLPSKQEGLPGAMTEAMAMGMPVVVTDVGSMGEIVRESRAGYIVEPSATAIAAAVHNIWNNEKHWSGLSTAAHCYAMEHFSERAVAQRYLDSLSVGDDNDEQSWD